MSFRQRLRENLPQGAHALVNLRDAGVGEVQAQRILMSAVAEEVRTGDVGDVALYRLFQQLFASMPLRRVTKMNRPPSGRVYVVPSGKVESSLSIASSCAL